MSIDELIILSAHRELEEDDRIRLGAWRRASPANETHYREILELARLARAAQPRIQTTPPSGKALVRAAARLRWNDRASQASRRVSARNWIVGFLAAASIAAIAWVVPDRAETDLATRDAHEPVYVTGRNDTRTVILPDGSEILLGPSSLLRVSLAQTDPHLWLEGRAFFAIAKRDDRRVIVSTPGGQVAVLGTRFDVQTQENDLKVVVLEGRVAISAGVEAVEVGTGEMSRVASGTIEPTVALSDPYSEIEWMGQAMVFQTTLLVDAVSEIEDRYGVEISILDAALGERTVTASFGGQPFDEVMTIICGVVRATCTLSDGYAEMGIQ